MKRHVVQKKYEYLRIIDRLEDDNLLVVIASIRDISDDWKTGNINLLSHHSHSKEFPLDNIPKNIQGLTAVAPTQISPMEFLKLTELYKNDVESFLIYKLN
ncbi:hypothetical protein [Lysinibacillus fusiformis]|uniref:hypothetical protein n=1 Tax=Lysinibacillus fusiformis TaxID=28031 RepID=UPI00187F8CF8|nr:hypothetical protein [Lysinibacillus fusiformis]MBD8523815.1 hypothetical protein [Lysinibacillus fusiformis]